MNLLLGDCLEQLKTLPDNSVDSVVTDPRYGLSFMGKKWDYDVPSVAVWIEVLRVLKPGGHLLSFSGTRTYHRCVVNIEDAGFEIRDQLQWLYGSGFPKSLDVSKAIDKAAGAEREVVGKNANHRTGQALGKDPGVAMLGQPHTGNGSITAPSTDLAKQWQGWGTALKPANEPIVLARKPLIGTVASNVEKYGTGGLNIDVSRIEAADQAALAKNWERDQSVTMEGDRPAYGKFGAIDLRDRAPSGRWPSNVLLDETAAEMLDEQSGGLRARGNKTVKDHGGKYNASSYEFGGRESGWAGDSGGASRFFYVAKASKRERNAGLEGMPVKVTNDGRKKDIDNAYQRGTTERHNSHPTVKPIRLMQYLIKLVTPQGGTVLDPFMGSGSTGVAAKSLGFNFIGCELSSEYMEIAKRRIENFKEAA